MEHSSQISPAFEQESVLILDAGYIGSSVELVECPCSFDTSSSLFLMRLLPCHFFVAVWGRGNVLKPLTQRQIAFTQC